MANRFSISNGLISMKSLFLFANTPIDRMELALEMVNNRLDGDSCSSSLVVTKVARIDTDFVIMVGINTFKINRDLLPLNCTVCLLDDPMILNCISGEHVKKMDFEETDEYGCALKEANVDTIADEFHKSFLSRHDTSVDIKPLVFVHDMLNAIPDKTTFIQDFSAIIYSVQGDELRTRIRRIFLKWCMSKETSTVLVDTLQKIMGLTRLSNRLKTLRDLFASKDGQKARRAIQIVVEATVKNESSDKKRLIMFEKIADEHDTSTYDLRYVATMAKKNMYLISNTKSKYNLDLYFSDID